MIKGITSDGGMLIAEEVSGARRKIQLQSDFNSFDFLKGLAMHSYLTIRVSTIADADAKKGPCIFAGLSAVEFTSS